MKKKRLWWSIFFIITLGLTQASSFIDFGQALSLLGFPLWLFYFIAVHVLFVMGLYYFDKHLFKEKE
ncbi:MAG: hypothetical protein V3V00_07120 [Saprospiraceae bacterium]